MISLCDINIWLALGFGSNSGHAAALKWFQSMPSDSVAFCRSTQQGFLRLSTNVSSLGSHAVTMDEAWQMFDDFQADPRILFLEEPNTLAPFWRVLASGPRRSTKLWNDAYLASFALAGNLQLVTFDRGFLQFPGLNLHLLP